MFRNQNFKPGSPGYLTDTLSEWERPQKRKIRRAIELPKCSDKLKNVLVVQFNFPGVVQAKSPPNSGQGTYYVYSAHSFKFSVDPESNFQLILNQISPPGNPHWHWQHCEPYPAAKEHTSWYNDVNKSLIYLQQHYLRRGWSAPNLATSWSNLNFNWSIVWGRGENRLLQFAAHCPQFSCLCYKRRNETFCVVEPF